MGTYVPACDVLYRLEVFLPCAISQMKALLSPLAITSWPPFLVISAWLSLTVATKSRLFKVSSCFPLFQVQALPFFSKPMCHAPVFQKERFYNFMIEKLPFFFDFDRNKVTSLMFADFPTILLTSSPFQKYVPGIMEACVLAFYYKINK